MLLLIDNFDSFTYNLVHYFEMLGERVEVVRGHHISPQICFDLKPKRLVIGPGPGCPAEATGALHCISELTGTLPILGVCLGHQAIGEVFGGKTCRANRVMHGKLSAIEHSGSGLFAGAPQSFQVVRYHSLIVDPVSFPQCLQVDAEAEKGEIMALSHKEHPTFGVQFHPEALLTEFGLELLQNFLRV